MDEEKGKTRQIFGPVPSRRLGLSLGVDTVPLKTCSLDCIYCQLGRTTNKTIERKEYIPAEIILREVEDALQRQERIDYITFSGSGEPTLDSKIRKTISRTKELTPIPIAILTNGTLLYQSSVREDLMEADVVIPSLDAATQKLFEIVNRPHPRLKIDEVISGIDTFSREFEKEVWLEIMLVRGVNDSLDEVKRMAEIIKGINLEKIQLNTVIRPPAERFACPLSPEELETIKRMFGKKCEIISQFDRPTQKAYGRNVEETMLHALMRRPMTLTDINDALGLHLNETVKYLEALERRKQVKVEIHNGQIYYRH